MVDPNTEHTSHQTMMQKWLPHAVMLALLLGAAGLVCAVFAPLGRPLLVAATIVALTHRVLLVPTLARIRQHLPALSTGWQHRLAAVIATCFLLLFFLTPVALILIDAVGGLTQSWAVLVGLVTRDTDTAQAVATALGSQAARMQQLYPAFPLSPDYVHQAVLDILVNTNANAFYAYLFKGTGGALAQAALTIVLMFAFYDKGDRIASRVLALAPFTTEQREEFTRRFQHATLHLLHDTVALAIVRGLSLGALAWLIAGFPMGIVAAVAAFVGLVPVVGYPTIWIPLASIVWSRGDYSHAIGLGVASFASYYLIGLLGQRLVRNLDTSDTWPGFLLFLGLIGGILSFGVAGLVIGPMAVVLMRVLLGFWLPLYGIGSQEPDITNDELTADSTAKSPS